MATRKFALNTEPHVADIGGTELKFQPEVFGDEFMDAYVELRDTQKAKGVDMDNLAEADPKEVRRTVRALRLFLARQMLEDSADLFLRLNVVKDGDTLETFHDFDQAEDYATQHEGARVVDALRLPTRVIVELLEWVVELFGGGNRPTSSSSASSTPSRQAGRRGTGVSPSRASTRTPGR